MLTMISDAVCVSQWGLHLVPAMVWPDRRQPITWTNDDVTSFELWLTVRQRWMRWKRHCLTPSKEFISQHLLTHWGRGKMTPIFQTAFSNAFSWMKMYSFRLIFHWSLFPRVQLTISSSIGSDNGLAPARRQAIIWTNDGLFADANMRHSALNWRQSSTWNNDGLIYWYIYRRLCVTRSQWIQDWTAIVSPGHTCTATCRRLPCD